MKYVLMIAWADDGESGALRVNLNATTMVDAHLEAYGHVARVIAEEKAVEGAQIFAVADEARVNVDAIQDREREKAEAAEAEAERQKKLDLFNRLKAELNL